MEKYYHKLVRDYIPKIIEDDGEIVITRVLEDEEYRNELYRKLLEESNEVISAENPESILEELADVLEVVRAIAELDGFQFEDIVDTAHHKQLKRGGFKNRVFLEKSFRQDNLW